MGAASVGRLQLAISMGLMDAVNRYDEPVDCTGLCMEAAAFGRQDVLEMAVREDVKCVQDRSEDQDGVQRVSPLHCTQVLRGAAWGGQVMLMQWLMASGCAFDGETMGAAASARCREAVELLRREGCEWDCICDETGELQLGSTMVDALEGYCLCGPHRVPGERPADLSFVRWLRRQGAPWSTSSLSGLIRCEHVEMSTLQWARNDGCPISDSAGCAAARVGRTDILSWLESLDALPRSKELITEAAREGHLEAVVWLRSHGCRWGAKATTSAAMGDHLATLQWAVANGCPWCPTVVADTAVHAHQYDEDKATGSPLVIAWLRQQGHSQVDWTKVQWEAHHKRMRFNYQVREQIKDEERMHNDDSSELGSSDADGDSAVEQDTSSVDSVDLDTPGPGDYFEQFGPGSGDADADAVVHR